MRHAITTRSDNNTSGATDDDMRNSKTTNKKTNLCGINRTNTSSKTHRASRLEIVHRIFYPFTLLLDVALCVQNSLVSFRWQLINR